ncbi:MULTISPECIES: peptidylprolyl isomerase [unclassified Nocardia]|uniref:peptidylprolyl isomerase n=1 Tax=unclassified Nocardia TaxID=2637762 RepID=UPI00272E19F7|nr:MULTISPECIES: peptidylprolyl isomerase [unclassified Nocardia]
MTLPPDITAAELLARHPSGLAASDAVEIIARAAERLEAAHRAGVVHGTVTPAALLIHPDRSVELLGLAGVPGDPRADVAALGRTLAELLLGPAAAQGLSAPPSRLNPNVPPALDAVVGRALGGGFGSAGELAAAATGALHSQMPYRPPAGPPKWLLIGVPIVVVCLVLLIGGGYLLYRSGSDSGAAEATATSADTATPIVAPPPSPKPVTGPVNCTYPSGPGPASKPVAAPPTDHIPSGTVRIDVTTNQGPIGLTLDAGAAPCTVNSFVHLARSGFYDGTSCHRLTTGELRVLQCGDPSRNGTGGPGYQFADEYPVTGADTKMPVTYQRGKLAMANAGPNTNGSQFFIVYGDSLLPPSYTIFGTVDAAGLATVDKVAAAGTDDVNGPGDGHPKLPITLQSAQPH